MKQKKQKIETLDELVTILNTTCKPYSVLEQLKDELEFLAADPSYTNTDIVDFCGLILLRIDQLEKAYGTYEIIK